jgi:hypothetical protein
MICRSQLLPMAPPEGAPEITKAGMRARRERTRRGLRRLTIDVSEDDLRAIAKRGYEGAVTTELDQQAQAVGVFLIDAPSPNFGNSSRASLSYVQQ